jgi:hypothetical protein
MTGYSRKPRYQVLINGVLMPGVTETCWQQADAYQCGTFSFTKALQPAGGEKFNAPFWADTTSKTIMVEIKAVTDGEGFTSQFVGRIDGHAYDPIANTIHANGRDLAGAFIDARVVDSYSNNTASEIAALLAKGHPEITATVISKTTTLAGRYYNASTDTTTTGNFTSAVNEWDLLCLLGQKEGIVPYIQGTTLHFEKPATQPDIFRIYVNRQPDGRVESNALQIQLCRSLTIAKDVEVFVKSWESARKFPVLGHSVTRSIKRPEGDHAQATKYYFEFPNLTQAQADAAAQREALDITSHERTACFTLPGEITIKPQTVIQLVGTGTDYDMIWYPMTVARTLNMQTFITTIQAKNCSPLTLYDGASGAAIPTLQTDQSQDS